MLRHVRWELSLTTNRSRWAKKGEGNEIMNHLFYERKKITFAAIFGLHLIYFQFGSLFGFLFKSDLVSGFVWKFPDYCLDIVYLPPPALLPPWFSVPFSSHFCAARKCCNNWSNTFDSFISFIIKCNVYCSTLLSVLLLLFQKLWEFYCRMPGNFYAFLPLFPFPLLFAFLPLLPPSSCCCGCCSCKFFGSLQQVYCCCHLPSSHAPMASERTGRQGR